ncbi:MAG: bifunctional oligoribonuclease/PAP phosphatase NrnA [Chloroflexi bacterium]|nr:bifunctional oligoribonuclease/PAP phosphatase NrnA [Chloroflexota bacterium]
MKNEALHRSIRDRLHNATSVVITSHIRPDGDAVGSAVGLGLSLSLAGKQVQMVLADRVSAQLRFIPGAELVTTHVEQPFDLSIVVDCSDLERTGAVLGEQKPDLNIDHHITNLNFANLNLVDISSVSTTALIARHLRADWDLPMDEKVASALLAGIVTDTIGFRTSNMTSAALRIAADLMDEGAELSDIYQRAITFRSYEAIRFWGKGIARMQRKGRLVWTALTNEDRRSAAYQGKDDADLINIISSIEDNDVSIIFTEKDDNKVKVSWRAQPGIDVSQIALSFGGGGHPAASGAEITGSLEEVQERVLEATKAILNGKNKEG